MRPALAPKVWGGRRILEAIHPELAGAVAGPDPIGEAWELADHPDGVSTVANGPLAGRLFSDLVAEHPVAMTGLANPGRYPLMVKVIDAADDLSLQVHPPAHLAKQLGGVPKTEMWYFTHATPKAQIYVGLKHGVTREEFARKVQDGTVADCFHRHTVQAGDAMFLPSGRVHALGAGSVLFEIQQNSDTTYRVFDWNRVGLDGKPRELHLSQAMASIDFTDFAPALLPAAQAGETRRALVQNELFSVDLFNLTADTPLPLNHQGPLVLAATQGSVRILSGKTTVELRTGEFAVIPASVQDVAVQTDKEAAVLVAEAR